MIVDHIRNRSRYYGLGERFSQALDALAEYKPDGNSGKLDIPVEGDNVYIKVRPTLTRPAEQCAFEAHRDFADIHFVPEGAEKIGYADIKSMKIISYDTEKDMYALEGEGELITLRGGYFMIAFPDDAHMPCVCAGEPLAISKLIAKVRVR